MKIKLVVAVCLALIAAPVLAVDCPSITWSSHQEQTGFASNTGRHLVPVDFDHDGDLDLVGSIDTDNSSNSAALYSWRNSGAGSFEAPVSLGVSPVYDLNVIDLNNDGYKDIVVASSSLIVRLGNATGFDTAIDGGVPFSTYAIELGQHDGDAFVDLVLLTTAINGFAVFHGNGNGTFVQTRTVIAPGPETRTTISSADFDGDGRYDVAVGRRKGGEATSNRVEVFFRNADNSYTSPLTLPSGDFPSRAAVADFNEDGRPDLAVSNWIDLKAFVYFFQANRTFTSLELAGGVPGLLGETSAVAAADFNGDQHADLLLGQINGGSVVTYLGNGDGTFRSASLYDAGDHVNGFGVGDFDGDLDLDIATGDYQRFATARSTCATGIHFYSETPMINTTQVAPLRAYVSGISAATPLPRGTVAFREGLIVLDTIDVDQNGAAALDWSGFVTGDHTLNALFNGNSQLTPVVSPNIIQRVTTSTTTIALIVPATSSYGTPYTVNIDLKENGAPFTDAYALTVDGVTTRYFSGGTIPLNFLPGPHTVSARFEGTQYRPPSNTDTRSFTAEKATPAFGKTGLTTVRNGTAHTLTFSVTGPANTTPTGTVQLLKGATLLGTATLGGSMQISTTLPRGAHDVTAVYSGDAYFKSSTLAFTLNVLPNADLAIDARAQAQNIAIAAVVPLGTTEMTLYRRVAGTQNWGVVSGWSPSTEIDNASLTRGVVYEYRLDVTANDVPQQSNVDSAMLFNDSGLGAGTVVKRMHFNELRDAINAFRAVAGLAPFNFDGTFAQPIVRASHVSTMRTAVSEARATLGLPAFTFTDSSLSAGNVIKAAHILELRSALQ